MKNSDIVKICSEPLKTVAKKYDKNDIDPSFMSNTLGYILTNYKNNIISDDDITTKNNPIGIVDPKSGELKSYNTLEEAFIQFKESYYCDIFNNKEENEEITKIAKAFNLYRFDKEILSSKPGNVVDLTEEESKAEVISITKSKKRKMLDKLNSLED